jgi:flagellar hook-basal body complex protein FliE
MTVLPVSMVTSAAWPAADVPQVGTAATAPTSALGGASGASGGDSFASMLGNAVDGLQAVDTNADSLATQAATGSLTNVADYMTAADEANIQTQLTSAVRNNALQAFQSIMGMQL